MRSLGKLDELGEIIEREGIDEVIIADPAFPDREALELVNDCHERGVRVRIAPSTMEILAKRADFVPGQTLPLFELRSPVFEGFDYIVKRAFDLVGAALLMIFLSPVLPLSALAVKLTSRGPVFYRSWRPGIGGERFACLKFRTMYVDADERQPELEQHNEAGGALFKIKADPRVTPAGRFLRRFSIDELPQLWNVLSGEMSLVGPRPLPQRDYDRLEDWHRKRNLVLPGMTGLWQVSGRAELGFDDLVRLDFFYLENWSVSMDLSILVKTIPAVAARPRRLLSLRPARGRAVESWREAVWAAVPAGAVPERFAARREFLLAHVRAGERGARPRLRRRDVRGRAVRAGAEVTAADVASEAPAARRRARAAGAWPRRRRPSPPRRRASSSAANVPSPQPRSSTRSPARTCASRNVAPRREALGHARPAGPPPRSPRASRSTARARCSAGARTRRGRERRPGSSSRGC